MVEIICNDNENMIAILESGAYFGEIGLLITKHRTATVKALTPCHFEVIDQDDFLKIMDSFPDQKDYLINVISTYFFKNYQNFFLKYLLSFSDSI